MPIAVLFMTIALPLFIVLHYRTKWKAMNLPSAAEHQDLTTLRDAARWMEQRIENLERVLDTEAPGWRSRSGSR
jgi:phage shock protein B